MTAVIFPFLGKGVGGSHIATFALARALIDDFGVRCVILCIEGSRVAEEAAKLGFEVAYTGEPPTMRHNPLYDLVREPSRLARLRKLGGAGPTIVHCNEIGSLQSWGPPAKLLGMRVVYHHQSINRDVLPNRMALAFADASIAVSDACKANLSYLPAGKVFKVLYAFALAPVDRAEARRGVLDAIGAPKDALLFGFVGNYWERKRPRFFLDACLAAAVKEPKLRFVLFGRDGDIAETDLIAYAQRIGVLARTHFLGFRTPPEANIAALDVLVMPALKEPFGRTLVEAMLLETPYVATDDAGHGEIARRWGGGVLAPREASAEDVAGLALSILRGETKPLLSAAQRAAVADDFSARRHAEAVLDVYQRIAPKLAIQR
jgi:glycosyltransferase involved in cell wall biosynthesis